MNKKEIIDLLKEKIPSDILNTPGKIIDTKESIISSGLIDSFSLVDLAMLVEDHLNVVIDDTELNSDTFDNLEQLAELILSKE
jgi:acyl carrier protein